ncbi:hypothetical protein B0H13DRAFT_2273015 [Mycena leptocephala]|nr:hypothetical protein B0H13DRAFT_2273015 [Mycena leptocephala]
MVQSRVENEIGHHCCSGSLFSCVSQSSTGGRLFNLVKVWVIRRLIIASALIDRFPAQTVSEGDRTLILDEFLRREARTFWRGNILQILGSGSDIPFVPSVAWIGHGAKSGPKGTRSASATHAEQLNLHQDESSPLENWTLPWCSVQCGRLLGEGSSGLKLEERKMS